MYLSHPVRQIIVDPQPDEEIGLVVELDTLDPAALSDAVAAAGGDVVDDLGFDTYHINIPESGVEHLCDLDGIERIETDATLGLGTDPCVP